jgi:hypothetical protein
MIMSKGEKRTPRQPALKFPHLQKKHNRNRYRARPTKNLRDLRP